MDSAKPFSTSMLSRSSLLALVVDLFHSAFLYGSIVGVF